MDKNLLNTIHRYAQDREIDFLSARVLGEQYGIHFKNEDELLEFKKAVDTYLKTFNESAFEVVENYLLG